MKIIATTDTHFGHAMLVKNKYREEGYESTILDGITNSVGDIFIHCGDICIGNDSSWHEILRKRTAHFKKRILVRGNHDNKSYSWYIDHGWDAVVEVMQIRIDGKEVLFSHMPILAEDYMPTTYHKPVLNIHGHLHGGGKYSHRKVEGYEGVFNYDIAPDTHSMLPVIVNNILDNHASPPFSTT